MKRMPTGWIAMGLGGILLILVVFVGPSVFRLFNEKAVMDEYHVLIMKADIRPVDLIQWLDQNIGAVSRQKTGEMVLELERMQQAALPTWQATFEKKTVQTALAAAYLQNGWTLENTDGLKDEDIKAMVAEAVGNGYKVETAEGMFFPVLDYTVYQKYSEKLAPDLAEYFEIMAVESERMPAKDAAIVIGWDEVLQRGKRQEAFLKAYPSSAQAGAVRQLLSRYTVFALYGSNNTPLFGYDTGEMNAKAKAAFLRETWEAEDGAFSELINRYLQVLEANNFRLTDSVEDFRRNAADGFEND